MKKTLVIGASLRPVRYANLAIRRLLNKEHSVEAIGLRTGNIAGMDITTEKILFEDIDTISLYLNPRRQEEYYEYIVSLKPGRVIFNPGTENPTLYEILRKNEIHYEVACTLVLLASNQY